MGRKSSWLILAFRALSLFNIKLLVGEPFDRAVLLVRDPFAAILAEFNRQSDRRSHIGHATVDKFKGDRFGSFAKNMVKSWSKFNLAWFEDFKTKPKDIIVIAYEDLVKNPGRQFISIMNHLLFTYAILHLTFCTKTLLKCLNAWENGNIWQLLSKMSFFPSRRYDLPFSPRERAHKSAKLS